MGEIVSFTNQQRLGCVEALLLFSKEMALFSRDDWTIKDQPDNTDEKQE